MRRALGIAAAAVLLVLVAVAAGSQGTPRFDPPEFDFRPPPQDPPSTQPPQTIAPWLPGDVEPNATAGRIVFIVLIVVGAAVVALLVFLIVRRLLRAWRERTPRVGAARPGDDTFTLAAEAEPVVAAPKIRRGIESARRDMDEHARASDAIVAAWVGLEETVAESGAARGRSETPGEFAVRIVTRREGGTEQQGAADAARVLLRLYERVRFADLDATEHERAAAQRALETLEEWWR